MVRILIYNIIFVNILSSNEPKSLDQFIADYLMLAKSKMESSPTVWQDFREGYLRSYGIYFMEGLLDSLDNDELTSFHAGIRHFADIEVLRIEVNSGKEFEKIIHEKPVPTSNINYFSSVSD